MKVVIADDEERVCSLICALIDWDGLGLEKAGTAYDGISALSLIEKEKPDLVITDIRMPGMDGLELIKKAKQLLPDLQFIIISGHRQFDYAQTAITYGVAEYLLKPIKKVQLEETLLRMRKVYDQQLMVQSQSHALKKQMQKDRTYLIQTSLSTFVKTGQIQTMAPWFSPPNRACICLVGIQGQSKMQVARHLNAHLEEVFEQDPHAGGIVYDAQGLAIYWTYPSVERPWVNHQCALVLELIKNQALVFQEIRATLAKGIEVETLEALPDSLLSARQALQERLVNGHQALYQATDIDRTDLSPYLKNVSCAFQQACVQEEEEAPAFCAELLKRMNKENLSAYQVAYILCTSFEQAVQFLREQRLENQDVQNLSNALQDAATLTELKQQYCIAMKGLLGLNRQHRDLLLSKPIRLAQTYMMQHYHDELISLESVSEQVHLNSSYFSALFKKSTGQGFTEYLLDLRINKAKELLVETNTPIIQIAKEIGYHDPKHFTKVFKKVCQIKPIEYRKLYG